MLTNPLWRSSVATFRDSLREWIYGADPEGPLRLAIFFDAAAVAGDAQLLQAAREHLDRIMVGSDAFLARFAAAADQFDAPQKVVGAADGTQRRAAAGPEEARYLPDRARRARPQPQAPGARERHRRAPAPAGRDAGTSMPSSAATCRRPCIT